MDVCDQGNVVPKSKVMRLLEQCVELRRLIPMRSEGRKQREDRDTVGAGHERV